VVTPDALRIEAVINAPNSTVNVMADVKMPPKKPLYMIIPAGYLRDIVDLEVIPEVSPQLQLPPARMPAFGLILGMARRVCNSGEQAIGTRNWTNTSIRGR
jgi:hypothetical protein